MALKKLEGNLYKIHLVSSKQSNETSNDWTPFVKAMDRDFRGEEKIKFYHAHDSEREVPHHYVYCPANGNTFMVVGKMSHPRDFACVRIVLDSENYATPYMVIYDHLRCFNDPDLVAEMLVDSFNWQIKGEGVRMMVEPWDTKGQRVYWCEDSELAYNTQLHRSQGKNITKTGYEDLVEMDNKKKARNERRRMANAGDKKVKIEDFVVEKCKTERIMTFLRDTLKNCWESKDVARPFRLLFDRHDIELIPFNIVITDMPELKGRVSRSRYNHWTNQVLSDYSDDDLYKVLNKQLDIVLK